MKAIITVVGKDRMGIIAAVSGYLAGAKVNILDISQTILQEYFTMMMHVDLGKMSPALADLRKELDSLGREMGLSITLQHDEVFKAMHRID